MTTTGLAMKNSQDTQLQFEDYEDLTLFADESFDTEAIDLFEFTSEEDSTLTRLKSIILSLDWEINDTILQELSEEVSNLEAMWKNDKIAEVYLQGLGKIGRYIQTKGAYAHPNAIKLLLTFFYNFEKIISSEKITETEITMLLKGDIRKFRILQYQINKSSDTNDRPLGIPAEEPVLLRPSEAAADAVSEEEEDHLRMLKASILSIDWEVTDDNLRQYNVHTAHFLEQLADDKPALILVQGLQALGDYIAEEKARAHPESFPLLHAFSDALEQVLRVEPQQRDQEQLQELLVDRVSRLNGLKAVIADSPVTYRNESRVNEVVDEIISPAVYDEEPGLEKDAFGFPAGIADVSESPVTPASVTPASTASDDVFSVESELDDLFPAVATPGMESAETKYPDEILPSEAIQPLDDSVADDLIHAEVSGQRGFAPALSEAEEADHGFSEETEPLDIPAQTDLAAQLDKLFAEDDFISVTEDIDSSPATSPDDEQFLSALSDIEAPEIFDELEGEDGLILEIEDKLNFFFGKEEEEQPEEELNIALPEANFEEEDLSPSAVSVNSETEESLEEDSPVNIDTQLDTFFDNAEEDVLSPALSDSEETGGFSEEASLAEIQEDNFPDIEAKLDTFFNEAKHDPLPPALADSEDTGGFSEEEALIASEGGDEIPEIEAKLDAFFSTEAPLTAEDDEALGMGEQSGPTVGFGESLQDEHGLLMDEGKETADELDLCLEEPLPLGIHENDPFPGTPEDKADDVAPDDVEELTRSIEDNISVLPSEAADGPEEERIVSLAALGGLLPGILQNPSSEKVEEACAHILALQPLAATPVQKVILQLLDNGLTQVQTGNYPHTEQTASLLTYLYEKAYEGANVSESLLPEIVEKFVDWQSNCIASLVQNQPTVLPMATQADPKERVAASLDIAQVKRLVKEEVAKLKSQLT
ncbi:MAG: hypothetical protein CSA33_03050 [Desulfobulbus propionicus]|nr:MAG: hypothetical protein CSA33_03050 [Desulfobulbus propionicus]